MISQPAGFFIIECDWPSCRSQTAIAPTAQEAIRAAGVMGYESQIKPAADGTQHSFWFCRQCAERFRAFDTRGNRLPDPPKLTYTPRLGWVRSGGQPAIAQAVGT